MKDDLTKTKKRRVYEFFLSHWLLTSLLVAIPAIGTYVANFCGVNFSDLGNNTMTGNIIIFLFLAMQIGALMFTAIKFYFDNKEVQVTQVKFYREQLQNYQGLTKETTRNILQSVVAHRDEYSDVVRVIHPTHNPFSNTNSRVHPAHIIKGVCSMLTKMLNESGFSFLNSEIQISVITRDLDDTAQWSLLYTNHNDNMLELDSVVGNSNSAFSCALNRKNRNPIFYLSKRDACVDKAYVPFEGEDLDKPGSIYSCNISLMSNNAVLLPAVFTIATLNKPFYIEGSTHSNLIRDRLDSSPKTILQSIFSSAEEAIQLELARMYAFHLVGLSKKRPEIESLDFAKEQPASIH